MNVIYISKYASYAPYGIETRHLYIAKHLVEMGHEVQVFISDANHQLTQIPSIDKDTQEGVKIEWIKTLKYAKAYGVKRILSWFDFEWKLRRRLKLLSAAPDVVIVSSLSLLSIINGIWLKKKYGCKLVFEVRDIWPLVLTRISSVSEYNPFYLFLAKIEKRGYAQSDLIVGTMPNLKEHVDHTLGYSKPVVWMPHLINTSVAQLPIHPFAQEINQLRLAGYKHIIGYAGSINKSSSLEVLLQAAPRLQKMGVAIVLVGDGPIKLELKQTHENLNVAFFDKMPQNQVVAFLKDCDFLYDGYLKSEIYKFGNSRNKYVEYCLASRPILVSYAGYEFFVEKFDCGLIVEPESVDALVAGVALLVQKDKVILDEMGQNAFNFAEANLQISTQVIKLLDALENV